VIEVDDREFLVALDTAVAEYKIQAVDHERERGKRIRDAARRRAPKDKGELVESIEVEEGRDADGPYFDVGTSVAHGTNQEYGTSKMSPHPFIRPSIEENST
jgi:HK97 gp10 family phage protein